MDAFATVEDFRKQYPSSVDADETIQARLEKASRKIAAELRQRGIKYAPDEIGDDFAADLMDVCCSLTYRSLGQGLDALGVPMGVSQTSITGGPYSQSYSFSNPFGDMRLTRDERRQLGLLGGRIAQIPFGVGQ